MTNPTPVSGPPRRIGGVTGGGFVWVLEWAAAPEVPLPPTTAHRTEAGARARIAAVAAEHGAEAVEEEMRPGPLRVWFVGDGVAMLRVFDLEV